MILMCYCFLFQVKYCSENNKRLIHFSTCEVYGKTIGSFLPKDSPLRQVAFPFPNLFSVFELFLWMKLVLDLCIMNNGFCFLHDLNCTIVFKSVGGSPITPPQIKLT